MGYSVGGAMVSDKHAGFVVNKGGATAKDVLDLIKYVQDTVEEKFGVKLEPEVKAYRGTVRRRNRMQYTIVTGMSGSGKTKSNKIFGGYGIFLYR